MLTLKLTIARRCALVVFWSSIRDNCEVKLMQKRRLWGYTSLVLVMALAFCVSVGAKYVVAQTATSPNYQVVESEFGGTTADETCSTQYCATVSIGELGSASSKNTPAFGIVNYSEPIIEMIVTSDGSSMGTLTTERTATKTILVKIRNYQTGGYQLQIVGEPPKYQGYTLAALTTPTASQQGAEQFGINVVANTDPSVGADPLQIPAGAITFGEPAEDYATANMFMYRSGDVVARSTQDSGGTDYTISIIINISSQTPAGHYAGDFSAVVIPGF